MGMSISVIVHLVMKHTIQFIAMQNLIIRVSYNAMPYMVAVAVNGLKLEQSMKIVHFSSFPANK